MTIFPQPPTITGAQLLPQLRRVQRDTLGFLLETAQRGDLVRFDLRTTVAYLVNHPDAVRHILQDNHKNYDKDTMQYNALATITGRGLLTSDGAFWFRQRRLAQPAFARPRLQGLDGVVVPAVEKMLARWEQAARRGELVDVDGEMMRTTLEVVGKALFSIDLSAEAHTLTAAVLTVLDAIVHRARNPLSLPSWMPTPYNVRFRRALRTLDEAVYALIAARRQSGESGDDLLGMLLRARDEESGEPMSEQQVRDEIITLLIAGHETVASALTWAWYLLAQYPDCWHRLRQEVQTVLGERLPTSADLPHLPYTAQVFSETLRLYPPAWLITRRALDADEVCGYRIPPRALMILSPYVLHRQTQFWPDPLAFRPERFAPDAEGERPRYAYIPFGGGPRLCIGNNFAAAEAQLFLAMVTRRFRLEIPAGRAVTVDALVTLRPRGGLHMQVHTLV